MGESLLMLGEFRFSVDSAVHDELSRSQNFNWATHERIGQSPALQFTGKGAESVSLRGRIYPEMTGSVRGVDEMREVAKKMADSGKPETLVTGWGEVIGEFVISSINETQRTFFSNGAPRFQEFSMDLLKYE